MRPPRNATGSKPRSAKQTQGSIEGKVSAKMSGSITAKAACGDQAGGADDADGGQKRLGRPVLFKGDPEAPGLTDVERRKIKR